MILVFVADDAARVPMVADELQVFAVTSSLGRFPFPSTYLTADRAWRTRPP
jgi:hypothetical protein